MPTVIPVRFRFASCDLWFDPRDTDALEGDHVICETERGQEIGLATDDPCDLDAGELKRTIGEATLRPVLRIATEEDLDHADELAQRGDEAMPTFRRLVKDSGLDMKPVGVEYLFDGSKVVCYFSADERVDFRQLVRDLGRELHQRIDMRQIGVREEAAIVGGFGHCGQELCCKRFGHQFEPVSIRMAKEQDLPLNSAKISGACGRLMCCLRYEFEAYRDFKQRAPKRNAVIDTPLGKAKIVEYDTPKEQLVLRIENGKQIRVALADMQTSEAAVKKSEELHCPCRPDTVTRDVLERLQSPDVQMALAELDRQNGVVPEETFDESDLFVSAKPRRRRRDNGDDSGNVSSGGKTAAARGARNTSADASADKTGAQPQAPTRKRRHRKANGAGASGGTVAAAAGNGSGQQQDQAPQQGKKRTRRAAQADTVAVPAAGQPTHRRRRHHTADEGEGAAASQQQPSRAKRSAGAKQASAPKPRRHPGDHGGVQDDAQRANGSQHAPKHAARPSAQGGASTGGAPSDAAQPAGEGKRRRRRHKRGGGNAGGNSAGGNNGASGSGAGNSAGDGNAGGDN